MSIVVIVKLVIITFTHAKRNVVYQGCKTKWEQFFTKPNQYTLEPFVIALIDFFMPFDMEINLDEVGDSSGTTCFPREP